MTQTRQDGSAGGTPPATYLASVGTALPGEPVDNRTLAKAIGVNEEWIEVFIGTRTRHFARDLGTGTVRWSLADLCAEAAGKALAAPEVDPQDVEFVVLGDRHARHPHAGDRQPRRRPAGPGPSAHVPAPVGLRRRRAGAERRPQHDHVRPVPHRPGHRRRRVQQAPRPPTGPERCRPRRPRQLRALRGRGGRRRAHRRAPRAARRTARGPQPLHRSRPRTRPGHRMVRARRPARGPSGAEGGLQGHRGVTCRSWPWRSSGSCSANSTGRPRTWTTSCRRSSRAA